jgi:hypothetical protein
MISDFMKQLSGNEIMMKIKKSSWLSDEFLKKYEFKKELEDKKSKKEDEGMTYTMEMARKDAERF